MPRQKVGDSSTGNVYAVSYESHSPVYHGGVGFLGTEGLM